MLYIASVIHIPKWAITKFKQMITSFIWSNKPAKIKYSTMIAPINRGGLQLQDLQTKIQANKISWIKLMINKQINTPWKAYLENSTKTPIHEIPLQNAKKYNNLNIKENFHCETLNIWASLKYTEPKNREEVYAQSLWQHELLTIEGKMIKYNAWNSAGIKNIIHILDNNGRIASLKFIENKYNIRPKYLEYNSLIHCIPKVWKDMIKNSNEHLGYNLPNEYSIKIDNKLTDIDEIATRELYCHISNAYIIKPATSKNRWIELYNEMDFENTYWELIYETPFKLTKNSKVQMTQYKIIHRILAVNHN